MVSAGLLAALFSLTIIIKSSVSIPMASPRLCSSLEPLVFNHGSSFSLECGSYCSASDDSSLEFKWSKTAPLGDVVVDLGTTVGRLLTRNNAVYHDGGLYYCQCQDNGPQCSYNVSVIPVMSFKASEDFVHPGDSFDLTCLLSGSPSNFSRVYAKQTGQPLPHTMHNRLSPEVTKVFVPVFEPVGTEYVCEAESYSGDLLVAHIKQEVTVFAYEPPSIMFTTEHVITNESQFGGRVTISCTVEKSPDTPSFVSWFNNGIELANSSKYSLISSPVDKHGIVKHQLAVSDLKESDIGSYLCQLRTSYLIEDVQEAWIQVDYRKDSGSDEGLSHEHGSPGGSFGERNGAHSNLLFFGLCAVAVLLAITVLWRLSSGPRPRPHPHIPHYHGNETPPSPPGPRRRC